MIERISTTRIKNWKEFQHFKDRSPPWIKLHKNILDNRDIGVLSDKAFRVLVLIWLLASEDKQKIGSLPSVEDIAFRLRMDKSMIIKCLGELDNFLISSDIKPISRRYQLDVPETETETEGETEKEGDIGGASPPEPPASKSKSFKKWTEPEFREKARDANFALSGVLSGSELAAFGDYWTEKGEGVRLMRFQRNTTFDLSRRIGTWARNNFNAGGNGKRGDTDEGPTEAQRRVSDFCGRLYQERKAREAREGGR